MAKALMIQGTGSDAGKSLITAALCRIFRDMGLSVAPFKAQNMALNSYITSEGGEIGRAQALQAEAAGIEPSVDMNPILLKVSGETGSQVIIHGKVHSNMKAQEYYSFKKEAWKAVRTSFDRLSQKYEVIVIEGAGSPAEINLMDVDVVNMAVAKHADAPVILVGDIDRGGVFASLYGTVQLLGNDSRYIKGFVINKFRGDPEILRPGLEMIEEKTGRPVIGVLPYIRDIGLPEEDGMALQRQRAESGKGIKEIKIVIVRLQYIANFTDFDPLTYEPDVEVVYSGNPVEIENADMVIIPGSKNTVRDMGFLKESGLAESIKRASSKGIMVAGICGGYQMMGRKIYDPHGVESPLSEIDGIGLLNTETFYEKEKITCRVEAGMADASGFPLRGYEIHMGVSRGDIGLFRLKRLPAGEGYELDGSGDNNCWGTYIHGLFENDSFRRDLLDRLRDRRGLDSLNSKIKYSELKDRAIDNLADIVRRNIGIDFIKRAVKI
ncbi:MAG: cobyric acid synthase [Nitrospirota bacterium]|nr:cobyric acid synthase [Nitrospirota bacterium]